MLDTRCSTAGSRQTTAMLLKFRLTRERKIFGILILTSLFCPVSCYFPVPLGWLNLLLLMAFIQFLALVLTLKLGFLFFA